MNTKPRLYQRLAFNLIVAVVIGVCFGARQGVAQSNPGKWQTVTPNFPYFPVHAHLLPTGKVMFWSQEEAGLCHPQIATISWDPANPSSACIDLATPAYDVFCAGHALLADGKLFVAGGNDEPGDAHGYGFPYVSIYDPSANTWTRSFPGLPAWPEMNAARWYPTTTVLANGDVLVIGGLIDPATGFNTLPQVFQFGTRDVQTRGVTSPPRRPARAITHGCSSRQTARSSSRDRAGRPVILIRTGMPGPVRGAWSGTGSN